MISIIACLSRQSGAIGFQNRLLYHIKQDMTRFRELTTGHPIVMGRKTFESLPHGALPHRRNIVVSRSRREIVGCEVYPTLEEALDAAAEASAKEEEIFVIGGESIYTQALPLASTLYLTIVDHQPSTPQADAFFPSIAPEEWEVTEKEMRNENELAFTFLTLQRV